MRQHGELDGNVMYLGFPWATLFDLLNKSHPRAENLLANLDAIATEIRKANLSAVATVCQHIHLVKYAAVLSAAGVTDVFWSHATKDAATLPDNVKLSLHPFPLYPVHISQSATAGHARSVLYSFVGAIKNSCYLTEVRRWIWRHLRKDPRGCVVARDMWHYHGEVYEGQIRGRRFFGVKKQLKKEQEFRDLLATSVFVLCPSGSGPNTIRLWEAFASGAIPVIISDSYLPPGAWEEWADAVVFCKESLEAVIALPARLEALAANPAKIAKMREMGTALAHKFGPENFGASIRDWSLNLACGK